MPTKKKTQQQTNDERAIRESKAMGSDNRGGQDHINPKTFYDGKEGEPNKPPFRGIRHMGD